MRNELRVFANGKMFYCTLDTYPELTERADWPEGFKLKHAKKMLATIYHDSNGNLIYYNDILEIDGSTYLVTDSVVIWLSLPDVQEKCEVIGNRLENSELLSYCKNVTSIRKKVLKHA